MRKTILFLGIIGLVALNACSKSELEINQLEIIGTWVSEDKTDTLEFNSKESFEKNHIAFKYNLETDSIQIQYAGPLFIGVHATKHVYSLNSDKLTIDFTNKHCYGFGFEIQFYDRID